MGLGGRVLSEEKCILLEMTSSGANTWSVPLEINNLESQITSATSGVQSITAGTNISLTGTAQNPIINSTGGGVSSITAGTNITIGGTASVPIINATGVQSVSAGTNITIGGTASVPIINATGVQSVSAGTGISVSGTSAITVGNTGVLSLTAGTNVSLTGTASNPIVNLVPSALPAGVAIDINGASYDFTNPALLANCILYSSVPIFNSGITLNFPTYAQLVSTYGADAVIPFTIGNLNQQAPPNQPVYLTCSNDPIPSSVFFTQSVSSGNWVADNKTPSSSVYVLQRGCFWRGTIILDSVRGYAIICLTWLSFM